MMVSLIVETVLMIGMIVFAGFIFYWGYKYHWEEKDSGKRFIVYSLVCMEIGSACFCLLLCISHTLMSATYIA